MSRQTGDALSQKLHALAEDVLTLSRNTLLVDLRFLAPALMRLTLLDDGETVTLATDGENLRYNPVYVLRRWQAEPAAVTRAFLHMALHCVYHHPFVEGKRVLTACWDLACDMAVEACIDSLSLPSVTAQRPDAAEQTMAAVRRALRGPMTAERIYRHYADQALTEAQLEALRAPFRLDGHDLWYARSKGREEDRPEEEQEGDGQDGDSGKARGGEEDSPRQSGREQAAASQDGREQGKPGQDKSDLPAQWRRIAARVQTDLETHSRQWAERASGLLINLKAGQRTRLSYREFLMRFAALTEVPESDPDSFDPIFYAYGLRLYGSMPLIEPLETAEQKRVRELAIVLDTSASVAGERVQAFLSRTCEMLLEQGVFDSRMRLHILECDAAVQRDTVITSPEELAAFTGHLTLHGRGGTDFRPAFRYLDGLIDRGELTELRGVLYLTDGDGVYPGEPPRYETAFLFISREDAEAKVPPWAIRVLLDEATLDQPDILYFA
ncbi:MAG: VWA-like domain-containing protein [Aristaeellaceae bacterium]